MLGYFFKTNRTKPNYLPPRYRCINVYYSRIYVFNFFVARHGGLRNLILFYRYVLFYYVSDRCNISNRFDFKLLSSVTGNDKLSAHSGTDQSEFCGIPGVVAFIRNLSL